MKKILFILAWSVLVMAGCNDAETIEEAFEQTMNETDAEYEIVEIAKDGRRGYVVYGQPTDVAEELYLGDTVFSTAFVQKMNRIGNSLAE